MVLSDSKFLREAAPAEDRKVHLQEESYHWLHTFPNFPGVHASPEHDNHKNNNYIIS